MKNLLAALLISLSASLSIPALAGSTPEERLAAAGYSLPSPTTPVAAYVTWRRSGNTLYLSGHGECRRDFTRGKVGKDLTLEEGYAAAQRVGLCMLATIKSAVGELSKVKQVLRIDGMVNAVDGFGDQPEVINGFSELFVVAFGDSGLGARAAVGMSSLPRNIPVEISAIVELHGD